MAGGFDGRALGERQKRFGHDLDGYLRLFESLHVRQDERLRVGCALHSLRAVPADAMHGVIKALPGDARLHVHIAEQVGEVQDCLAIRGARPVEWLLRSEEHTSELQSLMRISYAVFCLKKKKCKIHTSTTTTSTMSEATIKTT